MATKPKFEPTRDGLEIIDPIERHRYRLTMHEPVAPEPVDPEQINHPVDSAVEIVTNSISISVNTAVCIRNVNNELISEYDPSEQVQLPQDEYTLDLSGSLKLYIHFESSVYIYSDTEQTHIALDESTRAVVGARSYHTHPAGTVTTTDDPCDLMRAVSAFSSALKTTSPERSYPTLRGHPPTIELGDEIDVPDEFTLPETGVQIEIPPTLRHVFIASSLSYYLGAEVVSGTKPRIVTDHGFIYDLDQGDGYESTVARVLKQVFFLDCVVRTEGTTPLPLYERQEIESKLRFDIERVYEQPLAKQLETYLELPFKLFESYIPEWWLETRLKLIGESAEFLPFIVNNLATVSVQEGRSDSGSKSARSQTKAIESFTRGNGAQKYAMTRGSEDTTERSVRGKPHTIDQLWDSDRSSDIVSTAPLSSFYNSLGRKPKEDPIEIDVVCNDPTMHEELEAVNSVYGTRDELPFDITVHHNITKDDLRALLADECDFLHYIGHIDKDGFQCTDGKLDSSTVDSVGVKAFLLNACQSYNQGLNLVEAGSIGGIVTLNDVANFGAVKVGRTLASLLNQGFPLYAALDVTREDTISGEQYRIVGDGITTIAQSKTGAPAVCIIDDCKNEVMIRIVMYASAGMRKGSLFAPHLEPVRSYYLLPNETEQISVTRSQIKSFFNIEEIPVIWNGELYWSSDVCFE